MPTLQRAPTREYRTMVMDSHRWDDFKPRDGDIVVATYPKCGTTWTQRIVDLLLHQSADARPIMETYPWLDATFFSPIEADLATLEAQTGRRAIKSHLPFDSLPLYDGVKYIHVARDGRDACISMHNHQLGFTPAAMMRVAQANGLTPGDGPAPPPTPEDPRDFYLQWIGEAETGGSGAGSDLPFFDYEMTYWRERARPNLLLVHYNDLKADLAGEMRRISQFLDIDTPEPVLAKLAAAAEFSAMKKQGDGLLPNIGTFFDRGPDRFLNKGFNGRWMDILGADDLARYSALAKQRLSRDAAAWIEKGRLGAGDPRTLGD
ncbi:MAG TPA: sulfotransferase domain-containing protein [Phenylobacterium sp.]